MSQQGLFEPTSWSRERDRAPRRERRGSVTRTGPAPAERRPLVDIHGIAEYLGDSERHVRRLVAEQRIPYLKVGRLLRFDCDEVDRWLDAHRRPAKP
jgi:excisionase family DNA binding protein